MLKIYGTMLCPDCLDCRGALDKAGIAYEFLDFGDSTKNIKEFLKIRDENPLFDPVRAAGNIGIPCVVREDGTVCLDWEEVVKEG